MGPNACLRVAAATGPHPPLTGNRLAVALAAYAEVRYLDALVTVYGRDDGWTRYLAAGGLIRLDSAGEPWILVHVETPEP